MLGKLGLPVYTLLETELIGNLVHTCNVEQQVSHKSLLKRTKTSESLQKCFPVVLFGLVGILKYAYKDLKRGTL